MERVLIVDDDVELSSLLAEYLRAEGMTVSLRHDGGSGAQAALQGEADPPSGYWAFHMLQDAAVHRRVHHLPPFG